MTDDDKQQPENDPWADLNVEGKDSADAKDEFDFNFDGITEAAEGGAAAPGESDASAWDEAAADPVSDVDSGPAVPLMVFPPPDADHAGDEANPVDLVDTAAGGADAGPAESAIQIGTGQSGIIPMAAGGEELTDEEFDEQQLARDLLAMEDSHSSHDGTHDGTDLDALGLGQADGESSGFGGPAVDPTAEDVSFHAGIQGAAAPFAEGSLDDPFAQLQEAGGEEPASIPMHSAAEPALAIAGATVAATAARTPARKKSGGLRSMIGVVLGGLMAFPITGLILLGLIWGFQSERFRSVAQLYPSSVLPAKFQPGARKMAAANKGTKSGPSLDQSTSLDDLASLSGEPKADDDTEKTEAAAETDEPAEPEMKAVDAGEPAAPDDSETAADKTADKDADDGEPADADDASAVAAAEPKQPAMAPPDALAALPMTPVPDIGTLPGLDQPAPPAVAAPALPPLDLSGVDAAVERADLALTAVSEVADPEDPARKRLLVDWYRKLARVGEELAMLETVAVETGRPLEQAPASVAALYDRICGSEEAVADLGRLGAMWITREKRRADGVVLLATVDSSRRVGPYWHTQVVVPAAGPGGEESIVSVISRTAPPAETGSLVVITGVMFDGDSFWAADVRPAVPGPVADEADPAGVGTAAADDAGEEMSGTEDPSTEEPSTEKPSTEEPSTEDPGTEEPSTEEPNTEEPSTEEPSTEEPSTEEPSTEEPSTEEPSTEEPSTEEPSTEEPSTEEPSTEEPSTEEPSTAAAE